jgi:broad specificity phosphatase PhoE
VVTAARVPHEGKHPTFGPSGSTGTHLTSALEMDARSHPSDAVMLADARQGNRSGAFGPREVDRAVAELHRARMLADASAGPGSARRHRLEHWAGGLRRSSRPDESVRLFVFARHAESTANVARVVSSDPARSVGLTARGRAQARQLGAQLAALDVELAVCSSFLRTQETLAIALRGRRVPVLIDRGFDEIRAGDFDGKPIEAYWSWEQHHTPSDRFPRGESVDEALLRYANALRRLLSRTEAVTLLVVHEFALRHIATAATTPATLPDARFANALSYLFDEPAIERAAAGLEKSAQSDLAAHGRRAVTSERHDTFAPSVGGIRPCP